VTFEIWSDENEGAFVLLPFPGGDKPDTSGPGWEKEHTFEVESYADAQLGFSAWLAGRSTQSRDVVIQLSAYFSREKANAIVDAVGYLAASQIAHALDIEASKEREANQRQQEIQREKERGLTL
jgi:hypothetical protein